MPKGAVRDEAAWKRAKAAVAKMKPQPKDRYAMVMHVYKQIMGGKGKGKKDAKKGSLFQSTLTKGGGPYVGPKGGKWADPVHKVPWTDHHKKAAGHKAKAREHRLAQVKARREHGGMMLHHGSMSDHYKHKAAAERAKGSGQRVSQRSAERFASRAASHKAAAERARGSKMPGKTKKAEALIDWAGSVLAKGGGPYIGPKGGKWADPGHKVPWKGGGKKGKAGLKQPGGKLVRYSTDAHGKTTGATVILPHPLGASGMKGSMTDAQMDQWAKSLEKKLPGSVDLHNTVQSRSREGHRIVIVKWTLPTSSASKQFSAALQSFTQGMWREHGKAPEPKMKTKKSQALSDWAQDVLAKGPFDEALVEAKIRSCIAQYTKDDYYKKEMEGKSYAEVCQYIADKVLLQMVGYETKSPKHAAIKAYVAKHGAAGILAKVMEYHKPEATPAGGKKPEASHGGHNPGTGMANYNSGGMSMGPSTIPY